MKKIKIILLLSVLALNVKAQAKEEVKTIFGNGKLHLGYFISPSCQVGKIAGSTAFIPGVGAGVVFNNSINLGLVYRYIATENTPVGEPDNRLYLDERWGGIRCEYSIKPEKAVHFNFPFEVGISHIELDLKDSYESDVINVPNDDATFAYLEPGITIEINIWKYFKLDLGAGYRFVNNVKFRNLSEKDLMGLTYSAALKIGIF